ncbi:hypothetical protein [Halochromatium roseum]|uniref:hypothetical protein n=1 Tax=Halochromatium roseum TaxID=391920 RepID=UPI0019112F6D|nr:hypothetical protein [Halochromatium roseum]MBK5941254.1 hypothetical protein [Halochromatium roseum]
MTNTSTNDLARDVAASPFLQAFRGSFTSALRWSDLDALWMRLRTDAKGGWYLYAIGEPPPEAPADQAMVERFIDEIDALLRREHDERLCGIVYADDLRIPSLVKIYDPNNLGVACGSSSHPPLPGWVMSKLPPVDLPATQLVPKSRRRWWQGLFGGTKGVPKGGT